jgi:hypothetical protein
MHNELITNKKLARMGQGVCINCGLKPCCCAIPKWTARNKSLPKGMRRFKKRPKGVIPK